MAFEIFKIFHKDVQNPRLTFVVSGNMSGLGYTSSPNASFSHFRHSERLNGPNRAHTRSKFCYMSKQGMHEYKCQHRKFKVKVRSQKS